MKATERRPPSRESPRPKAVLFCAACGHESGIDGDWIVHESPDRIAYECPDCSGTVTTQPRLGLVSC